ncbi:MAG: hypothetical protein Q9200_005032 [Gallowayella weberi]
MAPHRRGLATVYCRLDGQATLETTIVDNVDTGQRVFEKIKEKQREISKMESRLWFLGLLVTRLQVGTAELRRTLTIPKDTEPDGIRVVVKGIEQDSLFSEAIRHPSLLAKETDFIAEYANIALGKPDEWHGQQVLVVYTVPDKEKIAWLLLMSLILSPALGITFGHFTQRAEVGVAVGAGVFACASFLQGLAAWLHK